MSEKRTIRYRGPAPLAGLLAQMLRDQGADVSYEAPMERRGAGEVAEAVVMMVVGGLTYDVLKVGVSRFLDRFGRSASVDLDDES